MQDTEKEKRSPARTDDLIKNESLKTSNYSISLQKDYFKRLFNNMPGYVEIRTILNGNAKSYYFKDYNDIFSRKWAKYVNIYAGMFTRRKKRGNRSSAYKLKALWADYDNITLNEIKYNIAFQDIPDPSMIINSGHGFHCYWLLDKPAGKEAISVIKKLAAKTKADTKATDPARVMRVPGSINNKKSPVKCEIIESNNKTYSLQTFADKLDIKLYALPERQNNTLKGFKGYESININKIKRPCIKSILNGVEEGQRNWALGRLIKYLQIVEGFNKEKTFKLLLEWNQRNDPPENINKLKTDFKSYWAGNYKLLGCKIKDSEYQQNLNEHCNRSECQFSSSFIELEINNQVKINNRIFNKYKKMTGNDLIIYGILLREKQGLNTTQLKKNIYNHYSKKPCMSRPSIYKAIKHLKSLGLIEVRQKPGRPKFCKIKPQGTYGMGYTLLSNGAIYGAIDGRITPAQFKVYVLLLKYAYGTGEAFPGVMTLSEKIGITHQTISDHLKELDKRNYIEREYKYNNKGVEKLVIKLLV